MYIDINNSFNSSIELSIFKNQESSFTTYLQKIQKVGTLIFKKSKEIAAFPCRYLGSKTWSLPGMIRRVFTKKEAPLSGYHVEMEKKLTPDEVRGYLKYMAIAAASFKTDQKWLEGIEGFQFQNLQKEELDLSSIQGIQVKELCLFNPKNGLKIVIAKSEKSDEVIIAFGSVRSGDSELETVEEQKRLVFRERFEVVTNLLGFTPGLYDQAMAVYEVLKKSEYLASKKVTLTGHCLGATIASYISLKEGISAVCFNPLPLGAGLQQTIGSQSLARADEYITNISAEGDFASDLKIFSFADRVLSFVGIRTPGHFGRRYSIPSAYTNLHKKQGFFRGTINNITSTHAFMVGSIMKHLGYTERSHPFIAFQAAST